MDLDWVTVVPGPDGPAATARALLALAETPLHVRTDGNGSEFRVPSYLADLYTAPPKPRRQTKKKEGDE